MVVVLAAIDAKATVRACLDRWLAEVECHGDLIVVDASRDGTADAVESGFPGVRVLRRPPGRLAPELWRDGLRATDARLVAFSTTQMVPTTGWRRALLDRFDETGAAVVGGPIEPAPGLSARDRAAYLLRYVNYLRPLDPARVEPPGDNAAYRRDRLEGLESLWEDGFWEVEVHRALRARGDRLTMAEGAVTSFGGGTCMASLLRRRYAHGCRYGEGRARRSGRTGRMARIVAAPAIPLVLLRRIAATLAARGQALRPWLPALPYLLPLLAAWSLGEACGMAAAPHGTRKRGVIECPDLDAISQGV